MYPPKSHFHEGPRNGIGPGSSSDRVGRDYSICGFGLVVWDLNGSLVLVEGKWDIGLTPPFQSTNWREADIECKNKYLESPNKKWSMTPSFWVVIPFLRVRRRLQAYKTRLEFVRLVLQSTALAP